MSIAEDAAAIPLVEQQVVSCRATQLSLSRLLVLCHAVSCCMYTLMVVHLDTWIENGLITNKDRPMSLRRHQI